MGLFDVFGAGGGTCTMQLQSMQVAPGQTVNGTVTFTGGKRAQNITNIKVRMYMTQQHPAVPGKPPPPSTSTNVVPEIQLVGAFSVQPGQVCPFPFQMQLPMQMIPEVRGQTDYKISAMVDIPGEVDTGATVDVQVVGGGMGMQQPMMGMGMQQPMMGQPMMGQPMMQPPPQMGPPQMGQAVMAQHPQFGGVHPGKVVAMQNGMIGVDWDDPNLGQSTWLQPNQVQAAMQPMMGQPMMGQPMMGQPMMGQPMMGKDIAHQKDMMAMQGKPGMGGGFAMGQHVMAQHPQYGGMHQGKVVGTQNGMVAVDWADQKLGASSWVPEHSVQHSK